MRGKILTVTAAAACVVAAGLGHGSNASAAVVAHSSATRGGLPAAAAALAAPGAPQIPALPAAGPGDPDTTVTFGINVGELSMTAPSSAAIGAGDPGTTIAGALGAVTVTDVRAALDATWTATASSTAWTTGGGTPAETIPAGDVTYTAGALTASTGTATFAPQAPFALSGAPHDTVITTAITGNNTATWDPTLTVAVPPAAVGGVYAGTISQSVA